MKLPTPSEISLQEYYDNYFIRTGTFNLEPIEKPDMSRYLIHLTGKGELVSILNGEDNGENQGLLKSSVPYYDNRPNPAKVVCFTESPIFALDFFRYKSTERWQKNQMYGIGFFKTDLIKLGVRPLINTDDLLTKKINHLFQYFQDSPELLNSIPSGKNIMEVLKEIYHLNFPLLDEHNMQGFTWEKEWRFPKSTNLSFSHELVRIICCPTNEQEEIKSILKNKKAVFINQWEEYNEIVDYLKRRQTHLRLKGLNNVNASDDLNNLEYLKTKLNVTINSLEKYIEVSNRISDETFRQYETALQQFRNDLTTLDNRIEKLKKNNRASCQSSRQRGVSPLCLSQNRT